MKIIFTFNLKKIAIIVENGGKPFCCRRKAWTIDQNDLN